MARKKSKRLRTCTTWRSLAQSCSAPSPTRPGQSRTSQPLCLLLPSHPCPSTHVQYCTYHARVWYFYYESYTLQYTSTYQYIPPCTTHYPEPFYVLFKNAVCTSTENPVLCTILWKYKILRIMTSCTSRYVLVCTKKRRAFVLYHGTNWTVLCMHWFVLHM